MALILPEVKKVKLQTLTLPTAWQTVIFRNYGYVSTERIAKVLGCAEEIILQEAKRLGLPDDDFTADFEKSGYFVGISACCYIKIVRCFAHQHITNTSPNNIGFMPAFLETT